jgi:hypothetical protein
MRYRLMATYRGVPYEAGIGPTDRDVVLFAACPPPEELGFEPATGHWRKQLRIQDVQGLWESRPMGLFRGERCIVIDDLGDRLHIAYLGHDAYQAEQLGYWQVDRGVFELVTPREEVTEIVEERLDYPHRAAASLPPPDFATGPLPAAAPQAAHPPAPARDGRAPAAPPRDGPWISSALGGTVPGPQRDLAVIPPTSEPPLPLEAAALRAASARTLQQPPTQPHPAAAPEPLPAAAPRAQPAGAGPGEQPPQPDPAEPSPRRRRSALRRLATQRIFSELASLAAIPPSAYAVGEEVDGAMCLIQTAHGFEVFNAAAGSRHEVRLFDDEESAYFYLFGVLAAEAVRTGRLAPKD